MEWHIEIFDSTGGDWQHRWYPSIGLDSSDSPHIAYCDTAELKYASKQNDIWNIEIVDSGITGFGFSSLALDADGLPHISYYDATNGDLKYAHAIGVPVTEWDADLTGPKEIRLLWVSPNPATTQVSILYNPGTGSDHVDRRVFLRVYDVLGRLVTSPAKHVAPPGTHSIRWNLKSDTEQLVSPGVYYLRIQVEGFNAVDAKRLVVVR